MTKAIVGNRVLEIVMRTGLLSNRLLIIASAFLVLAAFPAKADNITVDAVPLSRPQNDMNDAANIDGGNNNFEKPVIIPPDPAPQQSAEQEQPFRQMQVNNIAYITGGIGDEERNALDAMKRDYNLHVMSASSNGEFLGDSHITIIDRQGHALLNVAAGPVFYASLPPGTYAIEASSGGQVKKQTIKLSGKSSATVNFNWR